MNSLNGMPLTDITSRSTACGVVHFFRWGLLSRSSNVILFEYTNLIIIPVTLRDFFTQWLTIFGAPPVE